MDQVPAWFFGAMVVVGGAAVFLALAVMRASRRIPAAPVESDPVHAAAVERERQEVADIEASLDRDTTELETALAIDDADDRSRELARLMNGGRG
jgi:hypothetical protein